MKCHFFQSIKEIVNPLWVSFIVDKKILKCFFAQANAVVGSNISFNQSVVSLNQYSFHTNVYSTNITHFCIQDTVVNINGDIVKQ